MSGRRSPQKKPAGARRKTPAGLTRREPKTRRGQVAKTRTSLKTLHVWKRLQDAPRRLKCIQVCRNCVLNRIGISASERNHNRQSMFSDEIEPHFIASA